MAKEIERKYLVKKIPFPLEGNKKTSITQSYISTDPAIRLRKADDSYILTVKGAGHTVREEFELELTENQYNSLLQKTENLTIKKERYFIPIPENYIAELDIFKDKLEGLITVEVEFPSIEEMDKFIPPLWFGPDVSQNKRFKNTYLSKYGLS